MPPSQLKRLKASLREQGITGPQKSKKQKKSQSNGARVDSRIQRNAALDNIRESFNPFDVKAPTRPKKFDVTTDKSGIGKKGILGRPGVTKSLGEETRRRTLLPEMNTRNKVGGILDRRIGESDPTMTPEERMMERYAREKQRKKGASVFDLEDDAEDLLTHGGKSLGLEDEDEGLRDDFDAGSLNGSEEDDEALLSKKRGRDALEALEDAGQVADPEQPDRKKTKKEVMEEVIAKSKAYKYERQQAKEEDEELIAELNKDTVDLRLLLQGYKVPKTSAMVAPESKGPSINPERAAIMNSANPAAAEKEYDKRLRQMAIDRRAAPSDRTKTEEEKAEDEAIRLKELEEKRQRRMRGEESADESDEEKPERNAHSEEPDIHDNYVRDDAAEFGFDQPTAGMRPPGVDDEDDFMIDDDLIASGSDVDIEDYDEEGSEVSGEDEGAESEDEQAPKGLNRSADRGDNTLVDATTSGLAFTYKCPSTHDDFLKVVQDLEPSDLPKVVQRIRASHPHHLHEENKQRLAVFAEVLVEHVYHLGVTSPTAPSPVINSIIRHIHSMARDYPDNVGRAFRSQLKSLHESNDFNPGVLFILTAIGAVYPTSDHFHQVVTPATTIMARWLGMTTPQSVRDLTTGAYLCALCLSYQKLSKRYIPEVIRFTLAALNSPLPLSPSLLTAHITNTMTAADLWSTKSAFPSIFAPAVLPTLIRLHRSKEAQRLQILLSASRLARRPLALHHHRPLPIKTHVPKFEEGFNPDKHYDPDRDRAEASKLRAEYKQERKGALRELRKDANFVARERLREKREGDRAHRERERRLVAEIQGEEGREKKEYEKIRRARKRR